MSLALNIKNRSENIKEGSVVISWYNRKCFFFNVLQIHILLILPSFEYRIGPHVARREFLETFHTMRFQQRKGRGRRPQTRIWDTKQIANHESEVPIRSTVTYTNVACLVGSIHRGRYMYMVELGCKVCRLLK